MNAPYNAGSKVKYVEGDLFSNNMASPQRDRSDTPSIASFRDFLFDFGEDDEENSDFTALQALDEEEANNDAYAYREKHDYRFMHVICCVFSNDSFCTKRSPLPGRVTCVHCYFKAGAQSGYSV